MKDLLTPSRAATERQWRETNCQWATPLQVVIMSCVCCHFREVYQLLKKMSLNQQFIFMQLFVKPVSPLHVLQVPSVRPCLPLKMNGIY